MNAEAEWQRAKVAEKRGYWQAVVDTGGGSFSRGAVRALDDLLEEFDAHIRSETELSSRGRRRA